jgi:hypothetical protein
MRAEDNGEDSHLAAAASSRPKGLQVRPARWLCRQFTSIPKKAFLGLLLVLHLLQEILLEKIYFEQVQDKEQAKESSAT